MGYIYIFGYSWRRVMFIWCSPFLTELTHWINRIQVPLIHTSITNRKWIIVELWVHIHQIWWECVEITVSFMLVCIISDYKHSTWVFAFLFLWMWVTLTKATFCSTTLHYPCKHRAKSSLVLPLIVAYCWNNVDHHYNSENCTQTREAQHNNMLFINKVWRRVSD